MSPKRLLLAATVALAGGLLVTLVSLRSVGVQSTSRRVDAEENEATRLTSHGLDSMSVAQLERLYVGLTRLATLPEDELQALIGSLLTDKEDG